MPDFSFMWWRRNLFLLSGKHEYTGMLLTTNNVKWWCSSSASKSFLNPVKCICFWSFQLFNTLKYPYTEVYISSWCCNQLALANEIWCQRLPREITNASLLFVLCRAQKREGKFSTIVCGSVHVAQKTLVQVWYKKFSNLVWSKKFFFYFNFLVFHLLSYYVIVLRSQYLSSCQSIDEEARSHIRKL